jgi:capsule polysaccharide export protein KpsE/RkpR
MTLQLARAKAALKETENEMRAFQEKNRAIVLQDQTRGAIEAVARLKGEIMAAEVQLQVMRTWMTDNSPDVVGQMKRVDGMKRFLADLQFGDEVKTRNVTGTRREGDFHVPFAKVPEVGLELVRLTRELKIQEAVVTLLTQQFEQARLTEARDLPTVRILDVAIPPEKHYKPKFLMYTVITFAGTLFIGALLPFAVQHVKRLRRAWPADA